MVFETVIGYIEKLRLMTIGEQEIPFEYVYYLLALNVVTIFLFILAVFRVHKLMQAEDELVAGRKLDGKVSDLEESDDECSESGEGSHVSGHVSEVDGETEVADMVVRPRHQKND